MPVVVEEICIGGARATPRMPIDKVREDYRTAKKSGASAVGLNEVRHDDYRDAFRDIYRSAGWACFLNHTNNGLAHNRPGFTLLATYKVVLHKKRFLASPERTLNILVIRHDLSGLVFAHICFHFVNAAWNDRKSTFRRKIRKRLRKKLWLKAYGVTDQEIKELLNGKHFGNFGNVRVDVVYVYGDINKSTVEPFYKGQWIAGELGSIVKIGLCTKQPDLIEDIKELPPIKDVNNDHWFRRARVVIRYTKRTA